MKQPDRTILNDLTDVACNDEEPSLQRTLYEAAYVVGSILLDIRDALHRLADQRDVRTDDAA